VSAKSGAGLIRGSVSAPAKLRSQAIQAMSTKTGRIPGRSFRRIFARALVFNQKSKIENPECSHAFSSFFSSLKNRQSVPCAMIFCGLDLIMPASLRRSE
jgi:hypothetical protein